ncbi:MAG: PIG-L family deacetylase [Candidatus Omnitrophica bacterium]|nr:PIG-L family deacetylase [Candidatus Omnitrophota bacterium]
MNILAIGAHPDDIELGCAGTLLRYVRLGHHVYFLIMSEGAQGGDPAVRAREQESAAKRLGVKRVFWGGCEDTFFDASRDIVSMIERVCDEVKPDEVYVNFPKDSHQDHRALGKAVISATRYIPRVLFYEDYTSFDFNPEIFVDITTVIDEKIEVIKLHSSQVERNQPKALDMLESVRAVAHFRGFQGKVRYAEGFKPLRYLKLIDANQA